MNSFIKNTLLIIFTISLSIIGGVIVLFLLLWLLFGPVGEYGNTTSSFKNFQHSHEQTIIKGQLTTTKPKKLLSYRYKKLKSNGEVRLCYVNFYQLPNQFDTDKFLQQYQPIPKSQFIISDKDKPIHEEINLTNCLNLTQNYDWLQFGKKNRFWLLNYSYYRHFLVHGSTKNVHLMDLNVSSPNVEVFKQIDDESDGILLDRKNNIVKIISVTY